MELPAHGASLRALLFKLDWARPTIDAGALLIRGSWRKVRANENLQRVSRTVSITLSLSQHRHDGLESCSTFEPHAAWWFLH